MNKNKRPHPALSSRRGFWLFGNNGRCHTDRSHTFRLKKVTQRTTEDTQRTTEGKTFNPQAAGFIFKFPHFQIFKFISTFPSPIFKFPHFQIFKLSFLLLFSFQTANAQLLTPLSGEMNRRMEFKMIHSNPTYFTVLKPYLQTDSVIPYFSVTPGKLRKSSSWLKRKLFHESLVEVDSNDFYLYFDPVFDLSLGQENTGRNTITNTRGFTAGGRLGKNFAFGTSFYENQAILPTWVHNSVNNKIIIGQGRGRLNIDTWDYSHSSGYLSFSPVNFLNIQAGQGKNFIGDGYRSLLLSDVAYNYPYSRISFLSKKVMYSWMLGIIQDLSITNKGDRYTFGKRMISSHILSTNIGSAIQFSIIKNTVYNNPDTTGKFTPGLEEFSPLMLPVSSKRSNSIWGLNLKAMITKYWWIYGQATFDNLFDKETLNSGFQLGSKYFNAFGLKGLYLQAEYNLIDPKTYTSENKAQHWMHYNEPLAHPYGNNLKEGLFIIVYSWHRWQFNNFARITKQLKPTVTISPASATGFPFLRNGSDIFHNYTQLNWFLNPKTTAHFSLGYIIHNETIAGIKSNYNMVYFSFSTSLFNNYLNF